MKESELNDLYFRIFDSANVAMGLTDLHGNFLIVNKAWSSFLGFSLDEAKHLNINDITPEIDIAESSENYAKLISLELSSIRRVKQYKRNNGKLFWADLHVSTVLNDDNEVVGVLGIFVNIDEKVRADQHQSNMFEVLETLNNEMMAMTNELSIKNKQLEEAYIELERLARTDPLTGLYNRRVLDEILEREISRSKRSGRSFFVALADIDNFKSINDNYGHDFGDEVLKAVTKVLLKGGTRETDFVGRWGGEEFLIVLTETHYSGTFTVLERIREEIHRMPISFKGMDLNISITIGFTYQKTHFDANELIAEADQALYIGKKDGKNRVICYFDELIRGFG